MVKKLDESDWPDHVGWRLWRASRDWQAAFVTGMQQAGHGWFTDARASLLGQIGRDGVSQSALVERSGITKQAVQQLLDGLEADGVVKRVENPRDRRSKIIMYTQKGLAAMRDGNRIKSEIENAYRERLGEDRFGALMDALRALADRAR